MILPTLDTSFDWVKTAYGPALVCRPLESIARHLFTTRGWRLGAGIPAGDGREPWADLAGALAVDPDQLMRVRQVHGADVAIARGRTVSQPDADIVVTSEAGLALAVRVADCVPLLIADRRTGTVAAAHAGWRGLAARVPAVTIAALGGESGKPPGGSHRRGRTLNWRLLLRGWIGCPRLVRSRRVRRAAVGAVVRESACGDPSKPVDAGLRSARLNHWFFDGWSAARDQLIEAGVPSSQIFIAGTCTASHADVFCSYRRDGPPAGRLAAAIRCDRASSIALLASRSACAFRSRRTVRTPRDRSVVAARVTVPAARSLSWRLAPSG